MTDTSPFEQRRPLLVHCAHHKAGTTWFRRILETLASEYGLQFQHCWSGPVDPATDIAFYHAARRFRDERVAGRFMRGVHVIRDPRDLVVSGYFYHLRTAEYWASVPDEMYGGVSYQQYLRGLDQSDGLSAEIRRVTRKSLNEMVSWNYRRPDFLELRYEDIWDDEVTHFGRVFSHFLFTKPAFEFAIDLVRQSSIRERDLSDLDDDHVRSGRPGEWRELFGPVHLELCRELMSEGLVTLGYEQSSAWSA